MTEINQKGILEPNDLERNLKIETECFKATFIFSKVVCNITLIFDDYYLWSLLQIVITLYAMYSLLKLYETCLAQNSTARWSYKYNLMEIF